MIALAIVMLVVVAIGVAVYAAVGHRNPVGQRLAAITASAGAGSERSESSAFARLLDEKDRHAMARRLQAAGWYDVTPQQLVHQSIGGFFGGLALGIFFMVVTHHFSGIFLVLTIALAICGAYFPHARLNGAIAKRQREVQCTLPDFLDMLSTTVEAGIGLNGALATAVEGMTGALGDELRAALQDIRLGRSRSDALAAMAGRVQQSDLTTTVTALVQSERTGAAITNVLGQLSTEARERRLMRAEEIAGMLPTKLMFPMALFMLPALFVIVFGAALARLLYRG